jgi:7,8-dihydropterin-6-yl-methyl-4-(beta-D-ribofuranosyl)aminobenzene 5'-phosphate synthase
MSDFIYAFKFWMKTMLFLIPGTWRFYKNRRRADELWNKFVPAKVTDLGAVKNLTIMPLSEFYTDSDALVSDCGPSLLIKADDTTILFDVGFNREQIRSSSLLRNMRTLGVDIKDIKYIVISHLHSDHVGGLRQAAERAFRISPEEPDLSQIEEVFTPVPMHHPTAKQLTLVDKPHIIAPGVATEGTIGRALYFWGFTLEQALAVNVEGKGIFLITGCGHQGIRRMIERAEQIFDAPLYGIMGGLYYPVTYGRIIIHGMDMQRHYRIGKPPWLRITKSDVYKDIAYLKTKNLAIVSLSAHDSCDWAINTFREAFPGVYQENAVGHEIKV